MPTRQRTNFARKLRAKPTEVETLLWSRLSRRAFPSHRFRRQHPIGAYIIDFACLNPKLAIELDGGQHYESPETDRHRDAVLESKGFKILRFSNHEVFEDLDAVVEAIYLAVNGED